MRIYPQHTINGNVPENVMLVFESSTTSGEIITTGYIDADGNMYKVSDWKGDKPQPLTISEVCRTTLDSEQMLEMRWESWKAGLNKAE